MGLVRRLFNRVQKQDNYPLTDQLFTHSPVPTLLIDEDQVVIKINNAFSTLSGFTIDEVVGEKMSLFKTGRHDHRFYDERWKKLTMSGQYEGEVWSRCKDRSERLLLEKIQRMDVREKIYYVCVLEDVTESRKLVERYRYLAMHDALTGLANRSLAKDRFNHALINTVRAGERLGVLLCDLNEFKQINDRYGHHVGDQVLVQVAKKLRGVVREGDTVARIGGDEFLIIIERLQSEEELSYLVSKIHAHLQQSFMIEGEDVHTRISIGDACSPQDGLSYDTLLKIADHRMYQEKDHYYGLV